MADPHAPTATRQAQQAPRQRSDAPDVADQNRKYSYTETPVSAYPRYPQHQSIIPPLPTIPPSLKSTESATPISPVSANYYDRKPDPSTFGVHPAEHAAYTDTMTHEQSSDVPTEPRSPSSTLVKADPAAADTTDSIMHLVPDGNPLTPTSPTYPRSQGRPIIYQPHVAARPDGGNGTHLPGQVSHPNQQVKGGSWKHSLCDCGEVGVCCTGVWCPCIVYGKTQYRLSQRSEKKDPTNMLGYEAINGSCAVFAILCGCNWILAAIQHTRVRKMYDIPGGVGSDCVRAFCCTCCTLSQDEKEIRAREGQARQVAGPAMAQYATPTGMNYPAPPK